MESPASRTTLAQIGAWTLLLSAILVLSLRGWGSFQLGVYQDDAIYLVLARSIAGGEAYGLINRPDIPSPKFPFGFPLVLAPVAAFAPDNLQAATVVPLLATLLNASLIFWGWPLLSRTSRWWGLAVAALYGLSPGTIGLTHIVFSEPTFTTFVLLSLLALEACVRRANSSALLPLALGALLSLTLFTRAVGITMVVAAGLRLALARRGRDLLFAACGAAACVGVVLAATPIDLRHLPPTHYAAEIEAGRTFAGQTQPRLHVIWSVVAAYATRDIRFAIVPVGGGDSERHLIERLVGISSGPELVGLTVTGLTLAGFGLALVLGLLSPSVVLFQLVYCGVLVLWHWDNARFLYPVQPFLLAEFLFAIAAVGRLLERLRLPRGTGPRIAAGVCVLLLIVSVRKSLSIEDSRASSRDLAVGATWIADNTPADALVGARYPESVYLYARRRTVPLPSPANLEQALAAPRVDYVIIAPLLRWGEIPLRLDDAEKELAAALDEMVARGEAELVYQSEPHLKVAIYHLKPAPS